MNQTSPAPRAKEFDFRLFKRLYAYLKQRPGAVFLTIFFMLLMDVSSSLPPYFVKVGIDRDLSNGDFAALRQTTIILTTFLALAFLTSVVFNFLVQYLGQKLIYDLRMDVLKKLFSLPKAYFDKTPLGKNLTYLTNDVEAIKKFISEGIVAIIGDLLKVFFILFFMVFISPILTAFISISIPIFVLGTAFFRRTLRGGYRGVRRANATINTILVESLTGIKEIKLFNHSQKSRRAFDEGNSGYLNSYLRVVKAYSLYFPLLEVVSSLAMMAALLGAHFFIGLEVGVGDVFAFFIYINMFFRPLRNLADQFNTFQSAMSGAERIFKFLDTPLEKLLPPRAVAAAKQSSSSRKLLSQPLKKLHRGVEFRNVSFGYEPDQLVLKDLSFKVAAGEKVALVGSTGAGKTTIAGLLNRLYEIQSGTILLDGRPLSSFSLSALRRSISTIPQEVFLFTGTVVENVTLNQLSHLSAAEQGLRVRQAIRKALLKKFVGRLRNGYEEELLEEGKTISSGEKQLFALARAFLQEAPLVILDEATANIDSESEKAIELATQELLKNKTALIIAHRLSTIQKADRVLVLQQGRLAEEGSHQALIRKKGLYEKLHTMQSIQLA